VIEIVKWYWNDVDLILIAPTMPLVSEQNVSHHLCRLFERPESEVHPLTPHCLHPLSTYRTMSTNQICRFIRQNRLTSLLVHLNAVWRAEESVMCSSTFIILLIRQTWDTTGWLTYISHFSRLKTANARKSGGWNKYDVWTGYVMRMVLCWSSY
jgi:hypothetical protein